MKASTGLLLRILLGMFIIISKTRLLLRGIEQNDQADIWWSAFMLLLIVPLTAYAIFLLIKSRNAAR